MLPRAIIFDIVPEPKHHLQKTLLFMKLIQPSRSQKILQSVAKALEIVIRQSDGILDFY